MKKKRDACVAGLEKGHVETGRSEIVVGPLLDEMPLIPENTPGKAKLCIALIIYSVGWKFPNDVIVVSTWGCV